MDEAHIFYRKGMRLFLVARVVVGFVFSVNCGNGIDEALASSIKVDYLCAPSGLSAGTNRIRFHIVA
jgi:hypothetical protein